MFLPKPTKVVAVAGSSEFALSYKLIILFVDASCPKLKREPPVYVDPIVTRPFESITNVFAPPEIFENITTLDPKVPGPTSSPFDTKTFDATTFVVVTALEENILPVRLRVVCPVVPVKVPVTAARLVTFPVATLAVKELRVRTFPVTAARLVTFPVARLAVRTLQVVKLANPLTVSPDLTVRF